MSGGGVSLSRNPLAPERSARRTWSSASNVVRTMTSRRAVARGERLGRGEPVDARHADVHQHDVGSVGVDGREHLAAVGGLGDHADVVGAARGSSTARRGPARRRRRSGRGSGSAPARAATPTAGSRRSVRPCSSRPPASATRSASPTMPVPAPGISARRPRRRAAGCAPRSSRRRPDAPATATSTAQPARVLARVRQALLDDRGTRCGRRSSGTARRRRRGRRARACRRRATPRSAPAGRRASAAGARERRRLASSRSTPMTSRRSSSAWCAAARITPAARATSSGERVAAGTPARPRAG